MLLWRGALLKKARGKLYLYYDIEQKSLL